MAKISKDLVAASSGPIILSILSGGDHYGYQIIKKVKDASEGHIAWADGMLYPVLHKLEEKGYIDSYWLVSEEGRKRKYYRIRQEGKETLAIAQDHWSLINLLLKNVWSPETI
jgi:PadR family transcriptional regulator PadR